MWDFYKEFNSFWRLFRKISEIIKIIFIFRIQNSNFKHFEKKNHLRVVLLFFCCRRGLEAFWPQSTPDKDHKMILFYGLSDKFYNFYFSSKSEFSSILMKFIILYQILFLPEYSYFGLWGLSFIDYPAGIHRI
jgi:hypothetical protein